MTNKEELIEFYKEHIKANEILNLIIDSVPLKSSTTKRILMIEPCVNLDSLELSLQMFNNNLEFENETIYLKVVDFYLTNRRQEAQKAIILNRYGRWYNRDYNKIFKKEE